MSRKMSKLELLQEFRYTEKAKEVTDMVDLERKMKAYARQNDITVRSYNKDYQENDVASGALGGAEGSGAVRGRIWIFTS